MMASNIDWTSLLGQMMGVPMGDPRQQQGQPGPIPVDATVDGTYTTSGDGDAPQKPIEPHESVWEVMARWTRRTLIVLAVVAVIVLAGCYWWFHPAINLHSEQVWMWLMLIAAIVFCFMWLMSFRHQDKSKLWRRLTIIPIAVVVIFCLGKAAGWSIMPGNAERYATVLETVEGNFAEDIEEADYTQVPVIDRASAQLLGNRTLGSIPEYVSQFEIDPIYSQINYQGKPVRVSPLNYADLFKWFINRGNGIPGYVIVDMTTQEAKVVVLDQPILYSDSEPLGRNVDRYVQLKFPTYMFDEKAFELDEDGTPWWVYPVQKRTIGLFDGTDIQRVVLVNACTGECQDYAIGDCPQWVDRAYPSDLVVQQYNWSGLYVNGWLNSLFGQVGVVQTTPGTDGNLGYNYIAQNDDVYLYTGVSSVTADNSIVGFILVNQRTGESRFFAVAGATEESAMYSAEGKVQNLRYVATFPLLLNIEGQPTYFMALKDQSGLVKMYAMVNIQSYQNVAVGNTVAECQKNYLAMLAQDGTISANSAHSGMAVGEEATGKIASITQAVIDGNSHFYVTLKGDERIFDFALPSMINIVTYAEGDEIDFYAVEGQGTWTATGFEGDVVIEAVPQSSDTAEVAIAEA